MKINSYSSFPIPDYNKSSSRQPESSDKRAVGSDTYTSSSQNQTTDTSSISFLKEYIQKLPDVRSEKVDAVKEKISSGWYNNHEAEIVNKLEKEIL
jgi:flagellar biosynthesis anti-sigma factor FlgM